MTNTYKLWDLSRRKKISCQKSFREENRMAFEQITNFRLNFYDGFRFDTVKPTKNKVIVHKIDFKIFKRLSIISESHAITLNILKKSDRFLGIKMNFHNIENDKFYIIWIITCKFNLF